MLEPIIPKMLPDMPEVSIIIPCYNEENTIQLLLEAVRTQTFPLDEMEVIIADGMSEDQTRLRIADYMNYHPDIQIRVVDNPKRSIPSGLNRAIEAAHGSLIVRLDAHSIPDREYVERCVEVLEHGMAESVGGVWEIRPRQQNWQGRSIAIAASHPLGVGDAHYRMTSEAQQVDTVPFGAFRRELVEKIGYFDESLLSNEDYEFNVRLRGAGGRIWLDPKIRSVYFARPNLIELARQYWRYGYWKARMLRRHPGSIRWRQVLPPLFVLSLLFLSLLFVWWPIAGRIFVLESSIYFVVLFFAGFHQAWKRSDLSLVFGIPLAIAVMHFAWGSAFIWSIFSR
jgi:succinoglycan biosynthesis protein ExoA